MKLVIPTNGAIVAEHFGHCKTYTFLDENGKLIEVIKNTSEHMGGVGLPPELMKAHDADILLCRGIGLRAIKLCNSLGIKVYIGQASTINELFNLWENNKLTEAGDEAACSEGN
ncbi:MAG: NifB/NifX family molybdenum-iron cluster-binding protein [Candidatus Nanoarchaeia archaeon]|jgi:predicted Fe-Mo cluster-binding NifX family protein